jgi:hypothetical protein
VTVACIRVSVIAIRCRRGRKRCAAPDVICTANRALNYEVSRDARILAVNESGLDKRQTPNPGEA